MPNSPSKPNNAEVTANAAIHKFVTTLAALYSVEYEPSIQSYSGPVCAAACRSCNRHSSSASSSCQLLMQPCGRVLRMIAGLSCNSDAPDADAAAINFPARICAGISSAPQNVKRQKQGEAHHAAPQTLQLKIPSSTPTAAAGQDALQCGFK